MLRISCSDQILHFLRSDFLLQWNADILISNNITVILFIRNYREKQRFMLPRTEFFAVFYFVRNEQRKAPLHVFMSVLVYLHMHHRGSHWPGVHERIYCETVRKLVEQLQFFKKSDKNIGHFAWRLNYLYLPDRIPKYFVRRQLCLWSQSLLLIGNRQCFYIFVIHM